MCKLRIHFFALLGMCLVVTGCFSLGIAGFKEEQGRAVNEFDKVQGLPVYPAPIDQVEKVLLLRDSNFIEQTKETSRRIWREICKNLNVHGDSVPIVVYGSLMNPSSAAQTLSSFKATPVWLCGYSRCFSLDTRLWKKNYHPVNGIKNRGALTLVKDLGKRCSAVVLEMNEEDFIAARGRELCYRLVPVALSSYPSEESCGLAYAFVAEEIFCSDDILPIREYYYCVWSAVSSEEARAAFGKDFAQDFLETSFLANKDSVFCIHDEYKEDPKVEYITPSVEKTI